MCCGSRRFRRRGKRLGQGLAESGDGGADGGVVGLSGEIEFELLDGFPIPAQVTEGDAGVAAGGVELGVPAEGLLERGQRRGVALLHVGGEAELGVDLGGEAGRGGLAEGELGLTDSFVNLAEAEEGATVVEQDLRGGAEGDGARERFEGFLGAVNGEVDEAEVEVGTGKSGVQTAGGLVMGDGVGIAAGAFIGGAEIEMDEGGAGRVDGDGVLVDGEVVLPGGELEGGGEREGGGEGGGGPAKGAFTEGAMGGVGERGAGEEGGEIGEAVGVGLAASLDEADVGEQGGQEPEPAGEPPGGGEAGAPGGVGEAGEKGSGAEEGERRVGDGVDVEDRQIRGPEGFNEVVGVGVEGVAEALIEGEKGEVRDGAARLLGEVGDDGDEAGESGERELFEDQLAERLRATERPKIQQQEGDGEHD